MTDRTDRMLDCWSLRQLRAQIRRPITAITAYNPAGFYGSAQSVCVESELELHNSTSSGRVET